MRENSPEHHRHPFIEGEEGEEREEREEREARREGVRQLQSFDYHHGRPPSEDDFRDEPPPSREIFEYNHRPPPWNAHHPMPPQLPHGPIDLPDPGPRGQFGWPRPPSGPPPPDFPPPIPYFDLPAGLMVAIVPVSV